MNLEAHSHSDFLLLWLEGPFQSWGVNSKFNRRTTLEFPTRSGILGMLCCALGKGGTQTELLKKMSTFSLEVFSFTKNEQSHLDAPNLMLRDFQVAGGGYDKKNLWENLMMPKTANGEMPTGTTGAKIIYKYYLQNKAFAVVLYNLQGMEVVLKNAISNPCWDIYLGRKNCIPTDYISRHEIFNSKEEALKEINVIASKKDLIEEFCVVEEELLNKDGYEYPETLNLTDVPLQFGEYKKYTDRRITKLFKKYEC